MSVSSSSVILTLASAVAARGDSNGELYRADGCRRSPNQGLSGQRCGVFQRRVVTNNTPKPNSPATGQPTITGRPGGETLTADISGIGDDDGLPAESEFD